MAALALEAVCLLKWFVDFCWCVSWVACTFTRAPDLAKGCKEGRKPADRQPAVECSWAKIQVAKGSVV